MQRSGRGHATSASSTSGDTSGSGVRSTLHLPPSRISANVEIRPTGMTPEPHRDASIAGRARDAS